MSLVLAQGARIHSFNMCIGTFLGTRGKAVNKTDSIPVLFIQNEVKSSLEPLWSREMRNLGFAMFIWGRGRVSCTFSRLYIL